MNSNYSGVLVFFIFILIGCQKEINGDQSIQPSTTTLDSVSSIVFEGEYGGYNPLGYDSAVISYATGRTLSQHFDQSSNLYAIETLNYDNAERVVKYKIDYLPEQEYDVVTYQYSGTDNFPSTVIDTINSGTDKAVYIFTRIGQINDGNLKRLTIQERIEGISNPQYHHLDTLYVWLDKNNNLVKSKTPVKDEQVDYFFNATGTLIDSCGTTNGNNNDNVYCSINYTSIDNPLAPIFKQVYRNFNKYNVTSLVGFKSMFEVTLGICYLNQDLLQAKIPFRTRYGYERNDVEDEFTYDYHFTSNRLESIRINHKDLLSGDASQTQIRFHY